MSTSENYAVIEIAPLPLSIASTLMILIGNAYPNAKMGSASRGIKILIPENDEPQEVPADIEAREYHADTDAQLLSADPGGISIGTPEYLANLCLNVIKQSFEDNPEAINYLETKCYDKTTGKSYAMTFQRVEGKTPHEARLEAESERDALKKEVDTLKKNLHSVLRDQGISKKESVMVNTAKELRALPHDTIIKNPHVVARKGYGDVWYVTNISPQNSEELAGQNWTIVELGSQ